MFLILYMYVRKAYRLESTRQRIQFVHFASQRQLFESHMDLFELSTFTDLTVKSGIYLYMQWGC
jgi:hypothetical protein